ncbi:MAG: adaptor protein MecA [Lachnospiraceae bacterium]|nr:adaptor protein MecA [Lachnospiraceae bacterium]
MRIEKVNDNQIRCFLTREDMEERKIKFSELTFGSEKANRLFMDMMQQANYEYGFEPDDTPLMIEAVPMQSGVIVFVITKVSAPDEFESRLSNIATALRGAVDVGSEEANPFEEENSSNKNNKNVTASIRITGPEEVNIGDVGQVIKNIFQEMLGGPARAKQEKSPAPVQEDRIFVFESISDVMDAAAVLKGLDAGENSLYRDPADGRYHLALSAAHVSPDVYQRICTAMADLCVETRNTRNRGAYMEEHYEKVIAEGAIQKLSEV